jgi:hypothetical protein
MSISVSDELYEKVKHIVPAKKISYFVAVAINKEIAVKEQELRLAYSNAEQDQERQIELKEWDDIDVSN